MRFLASFSPFLRFLLVVQILAVIVFFWLAAIRKSQLSPHLKTVTLNGHVISSVWVTNPASVEVHTIAGVGSNGLDYQTIVTTNYYWHVWKIFQK
jgi:hypothetical protein